MPVLAASSVVPHTVKGRTKFNKLVNQRNQANSLMSNLGDWKDKLAQNAQQQSEAMNATLRNGWERHNKAINHVQEHGLNGEGQISSFQHKKGNTTIQGTFGLHQVSSSNDGWSKSNHNLQATLADGTIHTGGENWDIDAQIQIGDIKASMNHTMINDKIQVRKGLDNGPKASIAGTADLVHVSGTGSFGTEKDAPLGIRLEGSIDVSWGVNTGVTADASSGLSPFQLNTFGPHIRGDVGLVVDYQVEDTNERKEVAKVKMRNGKLDAEIDWRELGALMPKVV